MENPMDFSFSVRGVDTSFPSLAVGEYRVSFDEFKIKPTKNPGEYQIRISCSTQEPVSDTNGKEHKPGFKVGFNLSNPVGNEWDDMRIKQMAQLTDALLGTDDAEEGPTARPGFDGAMLSACVGKQFIVVVKKAKNNDYGETEVRSFKHIPTSAAA